MSIKNSDKDKFNLWDGLSITFIVQRYFSIFPLKRQGNEIVHSFFATIYSIFSAISYFSLLALALYVMYTEQMTKSVRTARRQSDEDFSKSYLIIVIAVFELIFNNVGIIVMIAFSHLKKNTHMLFLQKLYDIDLIIVNELKMDINYRQLRVKCYVAYSMIFSYYTFLMCYVFSKLNDFRHLTPGVGLLTLLYQFEQSATGIMTWSYISYVMLLYHRFVFIKQCQENVVKERNILLKSGTGYTENIPVLSTLLVTYKELCSCIDVLNNLSGSILILRIAHDFTLTTSQVYLISWIVMDNNGEDKFEMVRTICFWMFPNIVKMVLTTLLTEKTIDEAKQASYIINKSNKNTEDEDVQCMLDSFDLWLLHRKIEFNANNFFKIDLNLLYAVIGALTSYVLILIQFKQQEETLTTDLNSTTAPN